MAVYEHTYRVYDGALTPPRWRFLIIPRYAYRQVFQSRFFIAYLVLCGFPILFAGMVIYLRHNVTALGMMQTTAEMFQQAWPINGLFFRVFTLIQGTLAALLGLFMGPALLSPDMANNGLALYFARPLSRWEYLLGKFCILSILLSAITWVPLLLLFLLQTSLEGMSWFTANFNIAAAVFMTSAIWIVVLNLMTMAASALIRRRALAIGGVVAFFFVTFAMAGAINLINDTYWGSIIDVSRASVRISKGLFNLDVPGDLPVWRAWTTIFVFCASCLWLLNRKVRAYQVVR